MRVSAFVDGFNLYHAINDLGQNHLKWVNLRLLVEQFTEKGVHEVGDVFYFSAYCNWNKSRENRHRVYIRALRHFGVTTVMGNFKEKPVTCRSCGDSWSSHEEKQTDVNLAISLVREAYKDTYDRAIVISGDSDFIPAFKLVDEFFPQKSIKIISPPGRFHSKELGRAVQKRASIRPEHLAESLLPEEFPSKTGLIVRPPEYAP